MTPLQLVLQGGHNQSILYKFESGTLQQPTLAIYVTSDLVWQGQNKQQI
jgi:hypothetical protein